MDTTKNPKSLDVELNGPFGASHSTKLYGSYETSDGRLRMALGAKPVAADSATTAPKTKPHVAPAPKAGSSPKRP